MSQAASIAFDPAPLRSEGATYRKVTLRIVPFLFLCYLAAYLDRINVAFAKLQMLDDLKLSEQVYAFGASVFFIGYVLVEVPSNVVLHRVGARLWIARIMITWGLLSGAMIFVRTPLSFYIVRFLLGVAEAGFIPGVLLYLTYWYPARRRGRITAIFLTAIPMSSIFGGPLSGWILNVVSGAQGLRGWQWLFLIETIPSLILGVATLFYLDDRVASARWLDDKEKQIITRNVADEDAEKEDFSQLSAAFRTPRVWLLGLIYFGIVSGIYLNSFWVPTIIKETGIIDPLAIGLLTAIPYLAAVVAMIVVNASADRLRERRWHTLVPCLATALGFALTAWAGGHIMAAMIGLVFAVAGALSAQAAFWSLPASFLGGAAAAAGIALINSLGNLAGFTTNNIVGWLAALTHSNAASLYVFALVMALSGILVLAVPARFVNK
ncbi:MAG: MFS transporter [Acidibrevibacterium sp.]|jgi:D-galactonate transporter|uniref:MFS transporter n=1 Tax=Acidibrevibacterium fodinaquatile TaxID=1969806 RepID=UPI0023A84A5C|nr:MFS transporter [Acidibrevibacterium fodinaquatile]MCA7120519.1 MFS transporter [Acidibrevibacterium fodinaquatile]